MAYGDPLTYTQWKNALSDASISEVDCLARVIYAEDTIHVDGEYAVAKEIWNRKNYGNVKLFSDVTPATWKSILFKPRAYDVATGVESHCKDGMSPTKNSYWTNSLSRAQELVAHAVPSSSLSGQCYHRSAGASLPSGASSVIQIGGNKFFNY